MSLLAGLLSFTLFTAAFCQQTDDQIPEIRPTLTVSQCSEGGSCTNSSLPITLDANWRWLHQVNSTKNCLTGNYWDPTLCPDPQTCAKNCALDGADYQSMYGITTSGSSISMKYETQSDYYVNIGSRVYFMDPNEDEYLLFNLKNQEFTFDVDVSRLPCASNGALYFVQMDADGGTSKYPSNQAGAPYGTGYCDSQCPREITFIDGEANVIGWTPSDTDPNAGFGQYGACCTEVDIWQANNNAAVYTSHTCSSSGLTRCSGTDCGDGDDRYAGVCDKDGCDFNSFRMGDQSFYGTGKTVDTSSIFTVITQFITADNTSSGALTEVRRIYVQNGKVIQNSNTNVAGMPTYNSVTDDFCTDQKTAFGDTNVFTEKGGLQAIGDAFEAGMVLTMSIWDDHLTSTEGEANLLWLDSDYPLDKDASIPGVARGTCSPNTGGIPEQPSAVVTFSNIKYGPIGSTFVN